MNHYMLMFTVTLFSTLVPHSSDILDTGSNIYNRRPTRVKSCDAVSISQLNAMHQLVAYLACGWAATYLMASAITTKKDSRIVRDVFRGSQQTDDFISTALSSDQSEKPMTP